MVGTLVHNQTKIFFFFLCASRNVNYMLKENNWLILKKQLQIYVTTDKHIELIYLFLPSLYL